jgi:hypothetical protein
MGSLLNGNTVKQLRKLKTNLKLQESSVKLVAENTQSQTKSDTNANLKLIFLMLNTPLTKDSAIMTDTLGQLYTPRIL